MYMHVCKDANTEAIFVRTHKHTTAIDATMKMFVCTMLRQWKRRIYVHTHTYTQTYIRKHTQIHYPLTNARKRAGAPTHTPGVRLHIHIYACLNRYRRTYSRTYAHVAVTKLDRCACLHVCMHVSSMHVCMACPQVCIYPCLYACLPACMPAGMYACVHVRVHYTYAYAYRTYLHMYVCTYVRTMFMYVCVYVCMYVWVHVV